MASLTELLQRSLGSPTRSWAYGAPELPYGMRHGGTFPTAVIGGIEEGVRAVPVFGEAYRGETPVWDPATGSVRPEVIDRVTSVAGSLPAAGLAVGPAASASTLTAGGARPLFNLSRLDEVPDVPQFDLTRSFSKRGPTERVGELIENKAVREQMLDYITRGMEMGGGRWYNADPLRAAFNRMSNRGPEDFEAYMNLVAATSPRSEVGQNIRNASYYYTLWKQGQPMPEVGAANPEPYGHIAQRLHQMNAQRLAEGGGWDPIKNPKPAAFAQNLLGNQQPATIDTHAFRLPAMLAQDPRFLATAIRQSEDAPTIYPRRMYEAGELDLPTALSKGAYWEAQPKKTTEYPFMERYYQGLASELGITPAQAQAAAWVAGGKLTGLKSDESKPFMRFFMDRVANTAKDRGIPQKQVLEEFIRGQRALLSSGVPLPATGGEYATAGGF